MAGRVCYMSFQKPRPGGNKAYIDHILEVGHGSVLEHAVFSLLFTGVSRSLTHELVRHRAGFGFSQLSQRFVDESECTFIEPEVIAADPELHQIWLGAVQNSQAAYRELADRLAAAFHDIPDKTSRRKKAREAARSVLPNATETKIFVTANARALRHFIESAATRRPMSRFAAWPSPSASCSRPRHPTCSVIHADRSPRGRPGRHDRASQGLTFTATSPSAFDPSDGL